jgi:hypothetical protein
VGDQDRIAKPSASAAVEPEDYDKLSETTATTNA